MSRQELAKDSMTIVGPRPSRGRLGLIAGALGFALAATTIRIAGSLEDGGVKIEPLPPEEARAPGEVTVAPAIEHPSAAPGLIAERDDVSIALAHEEPEIDHRAVAQAALEAGELPRALTELRKSLHSTGPSAEALLAIGRIGRAAGDGPIAERALEAAVALDGANAEARVELARFYLEAGDLAKARSAAEKATKLDRESAEAWNLVGRVAMAESQWQRAEAAFRHAVAQAPTDPMLHNNLGLLYVMMKRSEEAVDALETAAELYGDEVPFFVSNNLGLAHEQAGHFLDAREAFEEALAANPLYARAQVNLRRIETALAIREEAAAMETAQGLDVEELDESDGSSGEGEGTEPEPEEM